MNKGYMYKQNNSTINATVHHVTVIFPYSNVLTAIRYQYICEENLSLFIDKISTSRIKFCQKTLFGDNAFEK